MSIIGIDKLIQSIPSHQEIRIQAINNMAEQAEFIDKAKVLFGKEVAREFERRRNVLLKSGLKGLLNSPCRMTISNLAISLAYKCIKYIESFGNEFHYLKSMDVKEFLEGKRSLRTYNINKRNNRFDFLYKSALIIQDCIDSVQRDDRGRWTTFDNKLFRDKFGSADRGYNFDRDIVIAALRGIEFLSETTRVTGKFRGTIRYYLTDKYFINHKSKRKISIPVNFSSRLLAGFNSLSQVDKFNLDSLVKLEPCNKDYFDAIKYLDQNRSGEVDPSLQEKFTSPTQAFLVKAFKEKDLYILKKYKISEKCNRRFTALTILKSDIRNRMYTIEAEPTVELDIRNSQAFQIANLINLNRFNKESKYSKYVRYTALNSLLTTPRVDKVKINKCIELYNSGLNESTNELIRISKAYDKVNKIYGSYSNTLATPGVMQSLKNFRLPNEAPVDFTKLNIHDFATWIENHNPSIHESQYFIKRYKFYVRRVAPSLTRINSKDSKNKFIVPIDITNIKAVNSYIDKLLGTKDPSITPIDKLLDKTNKSKQSNILNDYLNAYDPDNALLNLYKTLNKDREKFAKVLAAELMPINKEGREGLIELALKGIDNDDLFVLGTAAYYIQQSYIKHPELILGHCKTNIPYWKGFNKELKTYETEFGISNYDVSHYNKLCKTGCAEFVDSLSEGDFYLDLAIRGGFIESKDEFTTELRKDIKKQFCKAVYSSYALIDHGNKDSKVQKMTRALGSYDKGKLLRAINKYKYNKWNLAVEVMNLESYFMQTCMTYMMNNKMSASRIHDCLKVKTVELRLILEPIKIISDLLGFDYAFSIED